LKKEFGPGVENRAMFKYEARGAFNGKKGNFGAERPGPYTNPKPGSPPNKEARRNGRERKNHDGG